MRYHISVLISIGDQPVVLKNLQYKVPDNKNNFRRKIRSKRLFNSEINLKNETEIRTSLTYKKDVLTVPSSFSFYKLPSKNGCIKFQ